MLILPAVSIRPQPGAARLRREREVEPPSDTNALVMLHRVAARIEQLRRWPEDAGRSTFNVSARPGDRATESERFVASESKPLRDDCGPQRVR